MIDLLRIGKKTILQCPDQIRLLLQLQHQAETELPIAVYLEGSVYLVTQKKHSGRTQRSQKFFSKSITKTCQQLSIEREIDARFGNTGTKELCAGLVTAVFRQAAKSFWHRQIETSVSQSFGFRLKCSYEQSVFRTIRFSFVSLGNKSQAAQLELN